MVAQIKSNNEILFLFPEGSNNILEEVKPQVLFVIPMWIDKPCCKML